MSTETVNNEPDWLGSSLSATVTKCEVVEGGKRGKQLVIGLGIRAESGFMKLLPPWTLEAIKDGQPSHMMTSCKLTQPGCKIGVDFYGHPIEKGELKIEKCQLSPGLTIKAPTDPKKRIHTDAHIKLTMDYTQERVKYFGDHLDALVRFRAFGVKTEQQSMQLTPTKKKTTKRRRKAA